MKVCKRCPGDKEESEFYAGDSTCKECRKALVRKNRAEKAEYYREYDKKRFQEDPRVRERHKRYQSTPAGKQSINKSKLKWQEANTIKRGASTIVGNAVRDGKLQKPDTCSECGDRPDRIHGHHDDYALPLVVRWLCPSCHIQWHKENGERLNG